MPTYLGRPYNLDWRGDPPHMLARDIPVWYRFLEKWGFQFISLWYDCLLGGPVLTDQEKKDPMKRMWRINLAKRADAISELENELWIIEVSADPGLRAIGQLQTYRVLWLRDPKIIKPERLILVSETIQNDLLDVAGTYGMQVYIV
ncbi:unnamed protein product [marine sediment metagenome]|uniref:Uncharacterized protein n=1 Tax=marine sediment metagenome TaxID=412755 RepID=X1B8U5_9ZZZZ